MVHLNPARGTTRPKRQATRLLLPALLLAVASASAAQEVTIAAFDGASPIVYTGDDGTAAGIMPEVLQRILSEEGHTVRFITGIAFADAYERVAAGEIDLLPGAVYTEERARELDYNAEPIVVAWGQLGVLPGQDFDGLLELRGRRIGLMRDGQNAGNFVDLMERFDIDFVPVVFEDFTEITEALVAGDIAAGVYFNSWFRTAERVVPSSIVFSPTRGYVATAKGTNGDLLEAIDRRVRTLKADEGSYYYEILTRWLAHDARPGVPRWIWMTIAAVTGALIIAASFAMILRREVVRATRELLESRERYRTIADHAHGWEFWADAHGGFLYVSPNTEEVTGYAPEQFLADPGLVERIIVEEDRAVWRSHVDLIHTPDGRPRDECSFRIRTADGGIRWMEHRCVAVRASSGAYLGRRGSNIDVTDRIRNELALQKSLHEKGVLLQEVHHRVKNNLQMVSSLISLQRHTINDEATDRQLESIAGRIETMGALHTTIYREDSFEAVDMSEYLSAIISRVRETTGRVDEIECSVRIARVRLELSQALPVGLIVYEGLTNAHKHAFAPGRTGTIHVTLEGAGVDSVRLTIRDEAIGRPPESASNSWSC